MSDEPTKEELLEQARELDIEGRSQMSKDELRDAIAAVELPSPDTSAAFAPEPPPPPSEATYRVVGTQPVYDTPPGGTFTVIMPAEQEKLLLEGGHITKEKEA